MFFSLSPFGILTGMVEAGVRVYLFLVMWNKIKYYIRMTARLVANFNAISVEVAS
jgi:hypothetical protein